eukprot:gene37613-45690_t
MFTTAIIALIFCLGRLSIGYIVRDKVKFNVLPSKGTGQSCILATSVTQQPQSSANSLARYLELRSRPQQIYLARQRMSLPFAVLLMRSSYNSMDELDCVPMNEFQKQFFLFRQTEWEDYHNKHPNVLQGDLADPAYFDFISFAQYATISAQLREAKQSFVELVNASGDAVVVKRPFRYSDDAALPLFHSALVGDKLLDAFYEKYWQILPNNQTFDTLRSLQSKLDFFIESAPSLLDIFVMNSYALSMTVSVQSRSADGALLLLTSAVPANLWSLQLLQQRRELPANDFEVKLLDAFARRCGLRVDRRSLTVANKLNTMYTLAVSRGS